MFGQFFHSVIFQPLYNGLVGFITIVPMGDIGIALVLLTILVKIILFPLAVKASHTQMVMQEIKDPLLAIREKYKDDREKQAHETLALYRAKGINPFISIVLIFIQLPVIFGLYWVFYKGGFPVIDSEILYSFIHTPQVLSMQFLGLIDMGGKSALLALLAGATQYIQTRYMMPTAPVAKDPNQPTFGEDFAKSMHLQVRFVLPVFIVIVAYFANAAVALYWLTSNIAGILQEIYVRRNRPTNTL